MVPYAPLALCLTTLFLGVSAFRMVVAPQSKFIPLRPTSPDASICLTFALNPHNMNGLHAALMHVSDPASPNYGKHLSKDEVSTVVLSRLNFS